MNRMTLFSRALFSSAAPAQVPPRVPYVQVALASRPAGRRSDRQAFALNVAAMTNAPTYAHATAIKSSQAQPHIPSPTLVPKQQQQQGNAGSDVEVSDRLNEFRKFYETVSRTKELAPTPLGHGGSERILNNSQLHRSPWQASCVELRERADYQQSQRVLSYGQIDFSSLRRRNGGGSSSPCSARYSDMKDILTSSKDAGADQTPENRLEVVHYYETSSAAGLAGYQSVAMMVRKGLLPGRTENYSAEGGFGVWAVSHTDYVNLLTQQGLLEA